MAFLTEIIMKYGSGGKKMIERPSLEIITPKCVVMKLNKLKQDDYQQPITTQHRGKWVIAYTNKQVWYHKIPPRTQTAARPQAEAFHVSNDELRQRKVSHTESLTAKHAVVNTNKRFQWTMHMCPSLTPINSTVSYPNNTSEHDVTKRVVLQSE